MHYIVLMLTPFIMKNTLLKLSLYFLLFSCSCYVDAITVSLGKWRLDVDNSTGKTNIYQSDVLLIPNSQCAFKIGATNYLQEQLVVQSVTQTDINDEFGTGKLVSILSNTADATVTITHHYYLYTDKDYLLTDVTMESTNQLSSNYMSPVLSVTSSSFLPSGNNRTLVVPYDNDKWVRYNSVNFGTPTTSYEVGVIYNKTTRQGLIIGSIEHSLWKTGIKTITNTTNSLLRLEAFGGITSSETRDLLVHGSVKGTKIKSPKIMIGYFSDWRTGLETFADVNAIVAPRLTWNGKKPFGWNSWGALQSGVSYQNATEVSDYISTKLETNHFSNDNTVYIGLDSYWDNFSISELINFVKYCKAKGQKAGIYWAPFVDWGKDPNKAVEGATGYYYRDIYLYANGNPQDIDGAYAIDPTHPASKLRVEYYLKRFKIEGFEYLKLDFMTHGSVEADSHFDPAVFTGIQAYNQGMQHIVNYLGNTMYLNLSISPLFPANYANGRRIACDSYSSISETEYSLNSLTYGWWLDHVYTFNDADHVVLKGVTEGENRARVTSSVITGIFTIGDDFSVNGLQEGKDKADLFLTNQEVNRISQLCKAFKPVESGTGTGATDMFVTSFADTTYVAVFNYTTNIKSVLFDFNRIGLKVGTTFEVKEVWRDATSDHADSWSETLPGRDVKLFKIYTKTNTGTPQVNINSVFSISPNPCTGKLDVKITNIEIIKDITIYSLLGAKVRQFVEPSSSIQLDGLSSGMYFVSASSKGGALHTATVIIK